MLIFVNKLYHSPLCFLHRTYFFFSSSQNVLELSELQPESFAHQRKREANNKSLSVTDYNGIWSD